YTDRARATKRSPKSPAVSQARTPFSMSHSRSLTDRNSAVSTINSGEDGSDAAWADRRRSNSRRTFARFAASAIRSSLISRIVILSINSPAETGTRHSTGFVAAGEVGRASQPADGLDARPTPNTAAI